MKKILIIGSLNIDVTIETDVMPKYGETVIGISTFQTAGGKGANQAYAASKLGGNVSMMGAVGNDDEGKKLVRDLQNVGVNTAGIKMCEGVITGQAFVTVDKLGQNSIVVIPGANNEITVKYLKEHIEYLDEADIIVIQFEIPFDTICFVKDYAINKGKILIVDPAPAIHNIPDSFWKGIDYIKPNETELEILSGRTFVEDADIYAAASELARKGVKNVIVSLGDKGCVLINGSETKYFEAVKVKAVDTTAAGDSFTGAFAMALGEGKTPQEAISFAQKVASVVVTRRGAQASIPFRNEVK